MRDLKGRLKAAQARLAIFWNTFFAGSRQGSAADPWIKTAIRATMVALATLWAASAGATVYYVADCQAGATAGCLAGDDTNDGLTLATPWRTSTRVNTQMGLLQAGDEVRFARGSAFSPFNLSIFNTNSTAAAPIVFDTYTPPGGLASWPRPIMTVLATSNGLRFEDSGNANHDEGYVVRNLDIRGSDSSSGGASGIYVYNDADHITLENLSVSGFAIGMNCAASNPPANAGSDAANDYITLRNSTISNNGVQGYYNGGCGHVLLENNVFDNNGFAGPLLSHNHNIYIGDVGHNITVRGNTLTRSAVGSGLCQGVPLVVHGVHTNLLIEGNTIDETPGAGDGCYGIQVNPGYPTAENLGGTVIRSNIIINPGGNGISIGSCPDCVVENNRIVQMVTRTFFGINMPAENIQVGTDAADTRLTVRNNTIYVAHGTAGSAGIRVGTYGMQHVVVSNLVYYGAASVGPACFSTPGLTLASFTAFDYNLCFSAGTGVYSTAYATLGLAQAAGFDTQGLAVDPLFANTPSAANSWDVTLDPASPAIAAGHPTRSITTDRPNIGWQFLSAVPPVVVTPATAVPALSPAALSGLAAFMLVMGALSRRARP